MRNKFLFSTAILALTVAPIQADTFGTGANTFAIDFVNIGNAGNGDDAGAGGGISSSPYGGVSYNYRIGTYEVSRDAVDKAKAGGLMNVSVGPWVGNEPASFLNWYEAAAFVNWLNTTTGHHAAYQINASVTALTLWSSAEAWQLDGQNLYRHKDAYYFLANEDEWYKAAYHKNDGVTANYWDYATGSNTIPTQALTNGTLAGSAVFDGVEAGKPSRPADVNQAGGLSAYGTMGQSGNLYEMMEGATDGANDNPSEDRAIRGGYWGDPADRLLSSFRGSFPPSDDGNTFGYRIASVVPEPSCAVLMMSGLGALLLARRRRPSAH